MVWPEHWPTVLRFLDLQTCWRRTLLEMSGHVIHEGFRWADALALLREDLPRRRDRTAILAGLKIMERAALAELNRSKT